MNNEIFNLRECWNKFEESLNGTRFFMPIDFAVTAESKKQIDYDRGEPAEKQSWDNPGSDGSTPYYVYDVTLDVNVTGEIEDVYMSKNDNTEDADVGNLIKNSFNSKESGVIEWLSELYDLDLSRDAGDSIDGLRVVEIKNINNTDQNGIVANVVIRFKMVKNVTEAPEPDYPEPDDTLDEADKVTEPKADLSFNISDAWRKANTKDEKSARILIQQLVAQGFREQEAVEKITNEIRQFSGIVMEKCSTSLSIFRKIHKEVAKAPSIDDYLDKV
jgi:hypothetical protein